MSDEQSNEPPVTDESFTAESLPKDRIGRTLTPRGRKALAARTEAMARFVYEERKREPTIQYGKLVAAIRARFGCSEATATRAMSAGTELLRVEFDRWCGDAPRAIFDAYMSLHNEHVSRAMSSSRERDRALHLAHARRNLDSVRDMFGMRAAINININNGNAIPLEAFDPLSDIQLEALAMMDQLADAGMQNVLDVPSVEQSVDMAGVALDVIETNGANGANGEHEDEE